MSDPDSPALPPVAAPKPKRQLFNRPKWAEAPSADPGPTDEIGKDTASDNVFNRGKQNYEAIRKEQERKRKRKEEKARIDTERDEQRKLEALTSSTQKRSRVTDEDYARFGISRGRNQKSQSDDDGAIPEESPSEHVTLNRHVSDEPRPAILQPRKSPEKPDPVVIDIDSEVEEVRPAEGNDSDEEFPELVAAARERQRQLRLGQNGAVSTDPSPVVSTTPGPDTFPTVPPEAPDRKLKLLVTSPIEGTTPLLVYLRMSQKLQLVRHAWCEKQKFDQTMTDSVFLTYKLRKLHDVTLCKSLGLDLDPNDDAFDDGGNGDGRDPANVALVAVTEEIFERLKRERQLERSRRAGFESYLPAPESTPNPRPEAANHEQVLRIVLRAKGLADHRLKVKKTTTISRIIRTCIIVWELDGRAEVTLDLEGEVLDPTSTIGDTDIEDMETIDVYIRQ